MSLTVPPALLEAAERGPVDDADFVACVRDSLPYAWETVSRVVADLAASTKDFAAAFRTAAVGSEEYRRFVSVRGQLLNQSPELRDC
jgi:hypothetical protein